MTKLQSQTHRLIYLSYIFEGSLHSWKRMLLIWKHVSFRKMFHENVQGRWPIQSSENSLNAVGPSCKFHYPSVFFIIIILRANSTILTTEHNGIHLLLLGPLLTSPPTATASSCRFYCGQPDAKNRMCLGGNRTIRWRIKGCQVLWSILALVSHSRCAAQHP